MVAGEDDTWIDRLPVVLAGGLEVGRGEVGEGPCETCGALTDLCSVGAPRSPIAAHLCRDCLWEAAGEEALGWAS